MAVARKRLQDFDARVSPALTDLLPISAPDSEAPLQRVTAEQIAALLASSPSLLEMVSGAIASALTGQMGANNGIATLDAGGKVPASQLPATLMEFKGAYNAATNTPAITNGTGDQGDVYRVSVGGIQNFGAGPIEMSAGDYLMYNGSVWEKGDNSDAVTSVNGQQGIVTLTTDHVAEGTKKYFSGTLVQEYITSQLTTLQSSINYLTKSGTNLYYNGGNVGIGTNNPTRNLHIYSPGNASLEISGGFSGGTSDFYINTVGDTSKGRIVFQKSGVSAATLAFHHNASATASAFVFNVAGGSDELVILGNGNVGIGTAMPAEKLDVSGSLQITGTSPFLSLYDTDSEVDEKRMRLALSQGALRIQGYTDANTATGDFIEVTRVGANIAGMAFKDDAAVKNFISTTGNSYFTSGNVGIGTASPDRKLTVAGGTIVLDNNQAYQARLTNGGIASLMRFDTTNNAVLGANGEIRLGGSAWIEPPSGGGVTLQGGALDAANAVGVVIKTRNALVTAGARLASFQNVAVEKAYIDKDGGAYFGGKSQISTTLEVSTNYETVANYALNVGYTGGSTGTGNGIVFTHDGLAAGSIVSTDRGSDNRAALDFFVDGGASYSRAMRIDYNGNIGIGTDDPETKLDVSGSGRIGSGATSSDGSRILTLAGERGWTFEQFGSGSTASVNFRPDTDGKAFRITSQDRSNTVMYVYANNVAANSVAVLVPDGGRVGVRETAPDYVLDVNGSFGFTPGASVTPVDNGDVVFEFTNDTTITVRAKGSDGTVRSGTITLS